MTVSRPKDDENYTTVMVSLSNHESSSFDRLRMTRVEINNNSGLLTHFQMKYWHHYLPLPMNIKVKILLVT